MAISPTSRYTLTNDSKGRAITKRKVVGSSRYSVIMTVGKQTLDELAAIHLGDPQLYWRIAGVNPHVPYPDEVPAGTRLRIPQV
jgi:hypothetical protein